MKKLLLAFIIAIPSVSFAQKFEIGINCGIGLNSIPSGVDHTFPSYLVSTQYSPAAKSSFVLSAKGLVNIKRWQFGLGVDMQKISSKTQMTEFIYANPAIPVYAIANRKIGGFYAGFMGGALMPLNRFGNQPDQGVPKRAEIQAYPGYTFGAQTGYTYSLSDNVSFNIEAGLRYAATKYSSLSSSEKRNMSYFYYPVTVGFRFQL